MDPTSIGFPALRSYGPGGTSKQPRDVFNSHKTAASIKHQERTFYSPTPRYQSAAAANNRPLKIVIHKHYLALFSAPEETRQTQTPASSPRRSPVCVASISTCALAVKGPGPFLACTSDLCRFVSKHALAGRLGWRQLGRLATTKRATKQGRGGRQVVSGGRNCYLSLRQEQRKTFSRVRQKGVLPPSLPGSTIKLFTAISRRLRSPEGLRRKPC